MVDFLEAINLTYRIGHLSMLVMSVPRGMQLKNVTMQPGAFKAKGRSWRISQKGSKKASNRSCILQIVAQRKEKVIPGTIRSCRLWFSRDHGISPFVTASSSNSDFYAYFSPRLCSHRSRSSPSSLSDFPPLAPLSFLHTTAQLAAPALPRARAPISCC